MSGLSAFQNACLVGIARKTNDLAAMALEGHRSGEFDPDGALVLAMETLSILSVGFDDDIDHATIQRVIAGCGIAPNMRGVPANDRGFEPRVVGASNSTIVTPATIAAEFVERCAASPDAAYALGRARDAVSRDGALCPS